MKELKKIGDEIEKTKSYSRIQDQGSVYLKIVDFFETFGSHIKGGPFVFGGVFVMQCYMDFESNSDRKEAKKAIASKMDQALSISGSYSGIGA